MCEGVWGMCVCIDVSARARVYHTGLLCRGMINNNHNRIDQGGQDGGGMDGSRWRQTHTPSNRKNANLHSTELVHNGFVPHEGDGEMN